MLILILRNLLRRPLRSVLALGGISAAAAVLLCVLALGAGYERSLRAVLDRSGVQMMLVPMGCPYDSASRVLQNNVLEHSLPESAWEQARRDPDVAVAAPLFMGALPHRDQRRSDVWVGLDDSARRLKPWWKARSGQAWFSGTNDVVLGADVAALELREPGDKIHSVELGREFVVAGVLERSGTGDDSALFVPLPVAQEMFRQQGRLTAVAIRLRDPAMVRQVSQRLQVIRGAQVVTMTEMMGTFLNLLGAVRTLVLAVGAIAVTAATLTVFNTLLAAVVDRGAELAIMRALGASRPQIFALLLGESLLLTWAGAAAGAGLSRLLGPGIEAVARGWLPIASGGSLLEFAGRDMLACWLLAGVVGLLAAVYPAWRAATVSPSTGTGQRR